MNDVAELTHVFINFPQGIHESSSKCSFIWTKHEQYMQRFSENMQLILCAYKLENINLRNACYSKLSLYLNISDVYNSRA